MCVFEVVVRRWLSVFLMEMRRFIDPVGQKSWAYSATWDGAPQSTAMASAPEANRPFPGL